MTNTGLLATAGVIAAGLLGGSIAMRPKGQGEDPRAIVGAEMQRYEARIAQLEARAEDAERQRDAAQRDVASALTTAIEAKREIDRLAAQNEEIMSMLGGPEAAQKLASAKPAAPAGGALGAQAPSGPNGATISPYGTPAAAPPQPEQVAVVKQALDEIRKQEEEQQRVQREERRKQQTQRRLDQMAQRLGLNPGQTEQIAAVWEESQTKRRDMFESLRQAMEAGGGPQAAGSEGRDQMRTAMASLRTEEQTKIQQILTPAQYAEYQKMEEDTRGGFGGAQNGGGGGGRQGGGGRRGGGGGGAQ